MIEEHRAYFMIGMEVERTEASSLHLEVIVFH